MFMFIDALSRKMFVEFQLLTQLNDEGVELIFESVDTDAIKYAVVVGVNGPMSFLGRLLQAIEVNESQMLWLIQIV